MMDAREFMSEWRRMCKSHIGRCDGCPLEKHGVSKICFNDIETTCESDLEDVVHFVTEWSEAHPLVTNEMKFCEIFGSNATNSILSLYPSDIKNWLAQPYIEAKNGNSN